MLLNFLAGVLVILAILGPLKLIEDHFTYSAGEMVWILIALTLAVGVFIIAIDAVMTFLK
jgi:hypothetical protein